MDAFYDVPWMDGLMVNRLGVFKNKNTNRILGGSKFIDKQTGKVYQTVAMRVGRLRVWKSIMKSRAVALTFLDVPDELIDMRLSDLNVQFKDGNTANLCVNNLYWSRIGHKRKR